MRLAPIISYINASLFPLMVAFTQTRGLYFVPPVSAIQCGPILYLWLVYIKEIRVWSAVRQRVFKDAYKALQAALLQLKQYRKLRYLVHDVSCIETLKKLRLNVKQTITNGMA